MTDFRTMHPIIIVARTPKRIECSIVRPTSDEELVEVSKEPSWLARTTEEDGKTFADAGSLIFLKPGEHNPFHSASAHNVISDILTFFKEDDIPPESDFAAKTVCDVLREVGQISVAPSYLADFKGEDSEDVSPIKIHNGSSQWSLPFSEKIMSELGVAKSEHAFVVYQGVCYDFGSPEGEMRGPFYLQSILKEVGEAIRSRGEHFENTLKSQNKGYVTLALKASEPQKEIEPPKNDAPSL